MENSQKSPNQIPRQFLPTILRNKQNVAPPPPPPPPELTAFVYWLAGGHFFPGFWIS